VLWYRTLVDPIRVWLARAVGVNPLLKVFPNHGESRLAGNARRMWSSVAKKGEGIEWKFSPCQCLWYNLLRFAPNPERRSPSIEATAGPRSVIKMRRLEIQIDQKKTNPAKSQAIWKGYTSCLMHHARYVYQLSWFCRLRFQLGNGTQSLHFHPSQTVRRISKLVGSTKQYTPLQPMMNNAAYEM